MKTTLHFLAAAVLVSTALPAPAAQPIGELHPEESIPDNLPRLASPGSYDEFFKQIQQKLDQQGFDAGPVNGDFGSKTQAALAQYQLAHLLPASGMPDDQTLRSLEVQRAPEG